MFYNNQAPSTQTIECVYNVERAKGLLKISDISNDAVDYEKQDRDLHQLHIAVLDMQSVTKDIVRKVHDEGEMLRQKKYELQAVNDELAQVRASNRVAGDATAKLKSKLDAEHREMSKLSSSCNTMREHMLHERKVYVEAITADNNSMESQLFASSDQLGDDQQQQQDANNELHKRIDLLKKQLYDTVKDRIALQQLQDTTDNLASKKCVHCGESIMRSLTRKPSEVRDLLTDMQSVVNTIGNTTTDEGQ